MGAPRVIVAGGLSCAQSTWCVYSGFLRAGADAVYVPTTERKPDGAKGRLPQVRRQLDDLCRKGAQMLYWWQPQNDAPDGLAAALRGEFPGLILVGQSIDDPLMVEEHERAGVYRDFDLAVTCCAGSVARYEAMGVRAIVGYPPVDRDLHGRARPEAALECEASFAATNVYPPECYPRVLLSRADAVRALAAAGVAVDLYGHWDEKRYGWGGPHGLPAVLKQRWRGWIDYARLPALYASSRVNLNSHVRPDGRLYFNERLTTCMASGGFMVCDRVAGIEDLLRDGADLMLYGSVEELVSCAEWALSHDGERRMMAECGRRRALELFDNERLARAVLAACAV